MSRSDAWSTLHAFASNGQRRKAGAAIAGAGRFIKATGRLLAVWYERERQRRELSAMRPRDFGDLPLSPGMVRDEARRWPWQKTTLR